VAVFGIFLVRVDIRPKVFGKIVVLKEQTFAAGQFLEGAEEGAVFSYKGIVNDDNIGPAPFRFKRFQNGGREIPARCGPPLVVVEFGNHLYRYAFPAGNAGRFLAA
jgi:hypothetical protein